MIDLKTDELVEEPSERWKVDLLLLVGLVVGTFVGFGILGLLTGVPVSETISLYRRVLFFAAAYSIITLALNLHWGYTGLFNIGVAGFMAVGAYTMAMLTADPDASVPGLGLPIPIGVLVGVIAAGFVGFFLALPALRVRADYFAIITLGFSEIVRLSMLSGSLREFTVAGRAMGTGGGSGIRYTAVRSIIPWLRDRPGFGPVIDGIYQIGFQLGIASSVIDGLLYTAVIVVFVLLVYLLLTRIAFSPFGRVLKAIREDEVAARSLGKNTTRAKITVFVLGCMLMGLGGILWQGSRSHLSPTNFMPIVTFYVFVALIVGGSGSNTGAIAGAFGFAAFLWEGPRYVRQIVRSNLDVRAPRSLWDAIEALFLQFDPLPLIGYVTGSLDELRFVLVGVTLIVLMIWRPHGLLGNRKELSAATNITKRPATDGGSPEPPDWATDRSEVTGDDE